MKQHAVPSTDFNTTACNAGFNNMSSHLYGNHIMLAIEGSDPPVNPAPTSLNPQLLHTMSDLATRVPVNRASTRPPSGALMSTFFGGRADIDRNVRSSRLFCDHAPPGASRKVKSFDSQSPTDSDTIALNHAPSRAPLNAARHLCTPGVFHKPVTLMETSGVQSIKADPIYSWGPNPEPWPLYLGNRFTRTHENHNNAYYRADNPITHPDDDRAAICHAGGHPSADSAPMLAYSPKAVKEILAELFLPLLNGSVGRGGAYKFLSLWAYSDPSEYPSQDPYFELGRTGEKSTWSINRHIADVLIKSIKILHHTLTRSSNLCTSTEASQFYIGPMQNYEVWLKGRNSIPELQCADTFYKNQVKHGLEHVRMLLHLQHEGPAETPTSDLAIQSNTPMQPSPLEATVCSLPEFRDLEDPQAQSYGNRFGHRGTCFFIHGWC